MPVVATLGIEHLMTDGRAQGVILRIVDDVPEKPSARAFLEVRIVESAVRGIVVGSCDDGIHDVHGFHIRGVLRISYAWSGEIVFGIRADAHR